MDSKMIMDNFPKELLRRKKWVGYRVEIVPRRKKPQKIPKIGDKNINAKVTEKRDWRSISVVMRHADEYKYDGVGVCISMDDPFVAVDIDDCRDPITGKLKKYAIGIMMTLNSYTEVSPSGTGIHIIARGSLPILGRVNKDTKVEMYDAARFFTVTGQRIGINTTINERKQELRIIHEEYILNSNLTPSDHEFSWDSEMLVWEELKINKLHINLIEIKKIQSKSTLTVKAKRKLEELYIDIFPELEKLMHEADRRYIRTLPAKTRCLFLCGTAEEDSDSWLHRILLTAIKKWQPNRGVHTASFRWFFLRRVRYHTGYLITRSKQACYKTFECVNFYDENRINPDNLHSLKNSNSIATEVILQDFVKTLTREQKIIFGYLRQGEKQIDIARLEGLSYKTVKKHVRNIHIKGKIFFHEGVPFF